MGKLRGHTVYCAGPMEDVKDNGETWRKMLTPFLHNMGIGVFDPCNKPCSWGLETQKEREELSQLKNRIKDGNLKAKDEYHDKCSDIVSIDLRMVDLSSFVILYINRSAHMCGSYVEAAHARLQRKPMLIVCETGLTDLPGFMWGLGEHDMFFESWQDLKNFLTKLDENGERVLSSYNKSWKLLDYDKVYGGKIKWQE